MALRIGTARNHCLKVVLQIKQFHDLSLTFRDIWSEFMVEQLHNYLAKKFMPLHVNK